MFLPILNDCKLQVGVGTNSVRQYNTYSSFLTRNPFSTTFGTSLSPLLMNCFLHQLDTKLKEGMYTAGQNKRLFYYARYADDSNKVCLSQSKVPFS